MEGGSAAGDPERRGRPRRRRRWWRSPRTGSGWSARWPSARRSSTRRATIYSAKRFIGRKWDEVDEEAKIVSYEVVKGPNDAVRFEVRGKQYSPEEISALVLRKLADDAGKFLGEQVTEAVITVPAYFNDAQRQATKDAGQDRRARGAAHHQRADRRGAGLRAGQEGPGDRAGLRPRRRHLRRVDPRRRRRRGRGARHQRRHPPRRRRLRPADRRLPGRRVQARPGHRPAPATRRRCSGCSRRPRRPRSSCRRPPRRRSTCRSSPPTRPGPKHLNADADALDVRAAHRATWSSAAAGPVEQAMSDAKLTADDIDEVILVGGSTRIPAVQELVRRLTGGKDPNMTVNPDEVVALGAAHPGRRAEGRGRGRRAARRHAAVAGPRDAGRRDDQGDRAQHDDPGAPHRGVLHRRGQPDRGRHRGAAGRAGAGRRQPAAGPLPAGGHPARPRAATPQIEVTFDIDANGILNVSARDKDTGAEQTITITETHQPRPGRGRADGRRGAGSTPSEDRRRREEIDARNELDALAYQVEQLVDELRRPRAGAREGARRAAVADARQAIKEQAALDRVRSLIADLQQVVHGLPSRGVGEPRPRAAGTAAAAGDGGRRGGRRCRVHPRVMERRRPGAGRSRAEPDGSRGRRGATAEAARARGARWRATEDRYQRALADLDNYRKRVGARTERRVRREPRRLLLRDWLEVVDSVERALRVQDRRDDPSAGADARCSSRWRRSCARQGVERIGAVGRALRPRASRGGRVRARRRRCPTARCSRWRARATPWATGLAAPGPGAWWRDGAGGER